MKPWPEAEPSPRQPWAGAKGPAHCKSKPGPTEAEPEPGLLSRAGPCTSLRDGARADAVNGCVRAHCVGIDVINIIVRVQAGVRE
jgi:hypothetical protein